MISIIFSIFDYSLFLIGKKISPAKIIKNSENIRNKRTNKQFDKRKDERKGRETKLTFLLHRLVNHPQL
jgi:hypothetical protein